MSDNNIVIREEDENLPRFHKIHTDKSEKKPKINITNNEVQQKWNKFNDTLKRKITDPEIVGEPDYKFHEPDVIPLILRDEEELGQKIQRWMDEQSEKRFERIDRYQQLRISMENPEIIGGINIYADESCTENLQGEIFHVISDDEKLKEIIEKMIDRVGLHDKIWSIARNMCAYGDEFYEVVLSQDLSQILKIVRIPREMIERIEKNGTLQYFKPIDPVELENDQKNRFSGSSSFSYYHKYTREEEKSQIHPYRVLHFKIDSEKYGIYGEAVIDPILKVIEELRLMENAMLISRITRAPERRIFNINCGQLQGEKARQYCKKAVEGIKEKKTLDFNVPNKLTSQRNIFAQSEDYVLPFREGSEKNSIETLDAASNLGDIADVEFIRDRIFPGLGIPRQYLFDDQFANANINLSSKSQPFAKKIRRIQRFLLFNIYKLAIIELKLKGRPNEDLENFEIVMNNPSTIDEREWITLEAERWNLITTIRSLNGETVFFPDYYIYKDILKKSGDEIVEMLKLNQLQVAGQNMFNAFTPEERPEGAEELAGPEGEAGGEEMGGEEIPPEVGAELGPPPEGAEGEEAPPEEELASVQPDKTKTTYFNEREEKRRIAAERKKQVFEKMKAEIMESFSELKAKAEELEKRKPPTKIGNKGLEFFEISGQLRGLKKVIKNKNIYSEGQTSFYL